MANWGQKVYPSDYAEIKALLKAEVGRRGKTEGTARGQSVGSMASYNGSAYDFSTQPTAGAYIKNEHIPRSVAFQPCCQLYAGKGVELCKDSPRSVYAVCDPQR